jgi:hypothetical protein
VYVNLFDRLPRPNTAKQAVRRCDFQNFLELSLLMESDGRELERFQDNRCENTKPWNLPGRMLVESAGQAVLGKIRSDANLFDNQNRFLTPIGKLPVDEVAGFKLISRITEQEAGHLGIVEHHIKVIASFRKRRIVPLTKTANEKAARVLRGERRKLKAVRERGNVGSRRCPILDDLKRE